MGECPDWYDLIQAAKYLGVAPWDLMARSRVWLEWARAGEVAEAKARRHHEARQSRLQGQ